MSLKSNTMTESSHRKLEIEVDAATFDNVCKEIFRRKAKNMTVPGFRKGKAPRSVIEKMYGKGFVYEDAVNEAYKPALTAAIEEAGIEPVSDRIQLDVVSVGDEGLVFTAVIAVKPEASIKDYKGIKAEKLIAKVADTAVNDEIDRIRKRNSRMTEIDDRAAENGDVANIDYSGSVDGVKFDGGTAEGQDLLLGSNTFIPGFEEQVIGHKIGESFDITVKFPEEYHAENLAGKDAVFAIVLNSLKKEELPELDDEFAKDVSEFDTLDEYRASIGADLLAKEQKKSNDLLDEALMKELVELLDSDIPEEMYEDTIDREIEQWAYRLQAQGLRLEDYLKYTNSDIDDLRDNFRGQCVMQVKIRLALEKIVELEGITASEEEIEAEYAKIAEQYKKTVEELKTLIPESGIKHDVEVERAMQLVRDSAVVTEVEELSKKSEDDASSAE